MVGHEIVETHRPCPENRTIVKDTAAILRHERVEWENGEPKWAWESSDRKREYRRNTRTLSSRDGTVWEEVGTFHLAESASEGVRRHRTWFVINIARSKSYYC